jgi:hypothetical protein
MIMVWKWKDEEEPSSNGFYVVWRVADEGEGHAPAEWDGIEEWRNGGWPEGDWGIVRWWDQCYTSAGEAMAARVPEPGKENEQARTCDDDTPTIQAGRTPRTP